MTRSMEEIKSALMTYKEYNKKRHFVPYLFKIEKNGQVLYYFGSNHSYDPKNEQYVALKKYWSEFSVKTKPGNSLILVEGGVRPIAKSAKEAISKGAEANLITYLGSKMGYKTHTPEPGRVAETKNLLSKYTKQQIQYFYFARVVNQWGNMVSKPNFDEYINRFLERDKKETGWKNFDFSLRNMKKIHKSLFGGEFENKHTSFFGSISNPTYRTTAINAFSQDQGIERDILVVEEILKKWRDGINIFIVFGHTHAVVQEPVLKKLT